MAKNVFISFRFSDGNRYKEYLSGLFDKYSDTIDYSEDVDRSRMSDVTIKQYLYGKLRRSSVTIVLLTPSAVNHKKNWMGNYDDWMYDEIRYSLESREGNRTNGLIAVYTPEATDLLINIQPSGTVSVNNVGQPCLPFINCAYRYTQHFGKLLLCQRQLLSESPDILCEFDIHTPTSFIDLPFYDNRKKRLNEHTNNIIR